LIILITLEENKSRRYSLCSFLHLPVTSFFVGRNVFLSNLFSKTLRLCSSLNVIDHVSHPYRTTDRFIVFNLLMFVFFGQQTRK
jgi:hypothetical protein